MNELKHIYIYIYISTYGDRDASGRPPAGHGSPFGEHTGSRSDLCFGLLLNVCLFFLVFFLLFVFFFLNGDRADWLRAEAEDLFSDSRSAVALAWSRLISLFFSERFSIAYITNPLGTSGISYWTAEGHK